MIENSDAYDNPNHYVERGINELRHGNFDKAKGFMQDAQKNSGSLPTIIGGFFQHTIQLLKNPNSIDPINGFNSVKNKIRLRIDIKKVSIYLTLKIGK